MTNDELVQALRQFLAYPVRTTGDGSRRPADTAPGVVGDLRGTVDQAIGDVLGWRRRPGRIEGVLTALEQAFEAHEHDGRTVYRHRPNVVSFHSELDGGVVGAQASLHVRATEALNRSLPLLEGLQPLVETADEDVAAALKHVIETEFRELVDELGRLGGPRVQRVDQLWSVLLGDEDDGTDPDQVGGQLGDLRRELRLESVATPSADTRSNGSRGQDDRVKDNRVNTAAEEQQVTSFRILADDLVSLRTSWVRDRQFFEGSGGGAFLGLQLVLLERRLAVVAGSVREVRDALDSVLIDADERRTLRVEVLGGGIMLEDLLDWVADFATEEGPRLVGDGGRLAVGGALLAAARKLQTIVTQVAAECDGGDGLGLHSVRVREALGALARHLGDVVDAACDTGGSSASPAPRLLRRGAVAGGLEAGEFVVQGQGHVLGDWHRPVPMAPSPGGRLRTPVLPLPPGIVQFKVYGRTADGDRVEYPEPGFQKDYRLPVGTRRRYRIAFDPRVADVEPHAAATVEEVY